MADKKSDADAKAEANARAQASSDAAPVAYEGQSDERAARVKAYEEHQEALRTGGGDTRVTPTPNDFTTPLVIWPLEQATVPVDVAKPGSTIRVENANPVPPPTGTATGVTPDELSVGRANLAAPLTDAMKTDPTQTVDVAASAAQTPDEVATQRDGKA